VLGSDAQELSGPAKRQRICHVPAEIFSSGKLNAISSLIGTIGF
jgi:hypothetical protein